MAFTVFADGAKACIGFDLNGVAVSICLHWQKASPAEADYIALADQLGAAWSSRMLASQSNDLTQGTTTVYDLSAEGAPKFENTDESGDPGTEAGDSLANNTAMIISHRTTATGRSGRGRTYMPGVSELDVTDGKASAAYKSEVATAWGLLITDVEVATGWTFVVAQRFSAGVQLTTGIMREVVTEIVTQQLATQRRRQVQSAV